MRIFDDLRSGLTPAVEELHQSWDGPPRAAARPRARGRGGDGRRLSRGRRRAGGLLLPSERAFDLPLAVTLVAIYALMARVHFPIGYGFTIPTQLVLVPMLFLVPLGAVPLLVAAGMLLGGLPEYLRGDRHPEPRARCASATPGTRSGPSAVLAAAGRHRAAARRLADLPRRARGPVRWSTSPSPRCASGPASASRRSSSRALFGWVDARRRAALAGRPAGRDGRGATSPYAVLLVLPLAGLLLVFALRARRAHRPGDRAEPRLPRHDAAARATSSRRTTSTPASTAAASCRSRSRSPTRWGSSSTQRRNVEFGALLHDVGKIAVPEGDHQQAGPAHRRRVARDQDAHDRGPADARPRRRRCSSDVGQIVRSSHEHWDGSGYPDGLTGERDPDRVARSSPAATPSTR